MRTAASFSFVGILTFAPALFYGPLRTELKPRTVEAFEAYMRTADARLPQPSLGPFLWADASPDRKRQLLQGKVLVAPWTGKGEVEIKNGLVHDWVGSVFPPGVPVDRVVGKVQDYDRHKEFYKPEVLDSKLEDRDGDVFHIFLRLVKKKVITVTLNTHHEVRYSRLDANRWYSRSATTRISEVENAGEKNEREMIPGQDNGFLWRLNSVWRFEQRDGGVYVECEAISLTRDVPTGLGWLVDPIVRSLPHESLESTLQATRKMVLGG
jgi:hypothetical protein